MLGQQCCDMLHNGTLQSFGLFKTPQLPLGLCNLDVKVLHTRALYLPGKGQGKRYSLTCIGHSEIAQGTGASFRARNNGRSTDNVRTDWGFDRSNFCLAGHVDRSKFNRIENEINLRFLLFSCFSCYLSSRCVLRNFDMKC